MSTSINNLPKSENESQDEIMMVNSILKEIENDDDVNSTEASINYSMDESQIPKKINNELPTKEEIQETSRDIFENNINLLNNNINNKENQENQENQPNVIKIDNINNEEKKINNTQVTFVSKLIEKIKPTILVFSLFFIISIPQINKLIFKILPRMRNNDNSLSILGVILKGIFVSLIYLCASFYL